MTSFSDSRFLSLLDALFFIFCHSYFFISFFFQWLIFFFLLRNSFSLSCHCPFIYFLSCLSLFFFLWTLFYFLHSFIYLHLKPFFFNLPTSFLFITISNLLQFYFIPIFHLSSMLSSISLLVFIFSTDFLLDFFLLISSFHRFFLFFFPL